MRSSATSRICACVARDSISDTIPGPSSVVAASSKRRWMFSRMAGRLLANFDHLPSQVAEGTRRARIRGVLGDRFSGEGCFAELHRVLDHGVEDPLVAEFAEVLHTLAGE